MSKNITYLTGFANHFASEAIKNTLPKGQNAPQTVAHGLYAEQLSGSAFTSRPRQNNLRSWLYRIKPSVVHSKFTAIDNNKILGTDISYDNFSPDRYRWGAPEIPKAKTNFLQGLTTWLVNGSIHNHTGGAVHLYTCNQSMLNDYFYNADGELLIVPQLGSLTLHTEFGILNIAPKEIAVIPRGVKFQVELDETQARGYVLENFGSNFTLPELGPIGANGLANHRDFCYPTAHFIDEEKDCNLITKFNGKLFSAKLKHNPLDVVAWHGNYAPYKYDLTLFNTIGSISFDHPDPSIFTVLTSQTNTPGVANIDFVIFPERWMVAEHTFRPPYYHRNIMSEYMGLIHGIYDAKPAEFGPGGGSLHNCMSSHGPDKKAFTQASKEELKPQKYKHTLAFMFESKLAWVPTEHALKSKLMDKNYDNCWDDLPKGFKE